jgi:uncharacterized integral membrane protein
MTSAAGDSTEGGGRASAPPRRRGGGRSRGEQIRLGLAAVLGGLTVAFALLNLNDVEVNWILGTFSTPLIVVILASLLVGALLGFVLASRGRPKRAAARAPAEHRG